VVQEKRGWSESEQRTFSQRSKEFAQDYRYFPEPDLPPLELRPDWVEQLRASLPELPGELRSRLAEQYALSEFDVEQLSQESATARLFEQTVAAGAPPKQAANWIIGNAPTLDAQRLAELIGLVVAGTINREQGVRVLEEAQASGRAPGEVVREQGLAQVSDEGAIAAIVDGVIAANPDKAGQYRDGKTALFGFFVGQVIKASKGTANPKVVQQLLSDRLR